MSGCKRRDLPEGWDKDIPSFPVDPKGIATRDSSAHVLNAIAPRLPCGLLGGAADLAPSTKTRLTFEGAGDLERDNYSGRNFHFGIREHAMGRILQRPLAICPSSGRYGSAFPDLLRLHDSRRSGFRALNHGAPGRLRLHP